MSTIRERIGVAAERLRHGARLNNVQACELSSLGMDGAGSLEAKLAQLPVSGARVGSVLAGIRDFSQAGAQRTGVSIAPPLRGPLAQVQPKAKPGLSLQ